MNIIRLKDKFSILEYFLLFWALAISVRACTLTSNLDFRVNPIGFLLTVVPCVIVFRKRNIRFSRNILIFLAIFTVWVGAHYFLDTGFKSLSYLLLYIRIFVAYTVVNTFKEKLFKCFHDLVVFFTVIDLCLWVVSQIVGVGFMNSLAPFTPSFGAGDGSFLVFNVPNVDIYEGLGLFGLERNSGFCWEPGIYACIVVVAIFCNFMINGFTLKHNISLYILLAGLFTTFSTTGYSALIVLIASQFLFGGKRSTSFSKILSLVAIIPIILYILDLPFMSEKINEQMSGENYITADTKRLSYIEDGESVVTFERFEGMAMDLLNIQDKPILGYGTFSESYVYNKISQNLMISNGTTSLFACFGCVLSSFMVILLIFNSIKLRKIFPKCENSLFILIVTISVSYAFVTYPILMALGFFCFMLNVKSQIKRCKH